MPLFTDDEGARWTGPTRDDSPIAKQFTAAREADEGIDGVCFICDVFFDQQVSPVQHSMVDTFKEGQEAIFSIKTCAPHTGRWKHQPRLLIHDGQTQRWN